MAAAESLRFIRQIKKELSNLVESDDQLQCPAAALQTAPGAITAITLVAELPQLGRLSGHPISPPNSRAAIFCALEFGDEI